MEECRQPGLLHLDRPVRAHRGGVRVAPAASSTCTRWPWRTPSTRTSGPSSRSFGDIVFIVLKTARYVDPTEVIKLGEILVFLGDDYIITVRHGEASELGGVRQQLEENPKLLQHGPGAVLHAIVDRVVDDYAARDRRPRGGHRPGRGPRSSQRVRSQPRRSASTSSSARCSSSGTAPHRWWIRSTGSRAGKYERDPPRGAHATSATSTTTCCARTTSSSATATCSRSIAPGQPDPGGGAPERGHAQDLGLRWRSRPCRPLIAGIYGMNFEHMPELGWEVGYPMRARADGVIVSPVWRSLLLL